MTKLTLGTIGCFLRAHSGDYKGLGLAKRIRTYSNSPAPRVLGAFSPNDICASSRPAWRRSDDGESACRLTATPSKTAGRRRNKLCTGR